VTVILRMRVDVSTQDHAHILTYPSLIYSYILDLSALLSMADLRILLLDSDNRHPPIDSDYGPLIKHFTDLHVCVQYVRDERANCRRIDLFLSSADRGIINTQVPLFDGVYFHLYCPTNDNIAENEALFPQRERVQVFEELYLWIQIGMTNLNNDFMRLRTIDDRNHALIVLQTTLRIALNEAYDAKAGQQPN
jgi:hypothetical protein